MSNAGDGGRGAGCERLAGGGAAAGGGAGRWLGGVGRLSASWWIPRLTDPGELVDAPGCWLVVVVAGGGGGSPTYAAAQQQPSRGVALALRGQVLVYWEHPWEHPRHKKGPVVAHYGDRPTSKQPTRKASIFPWATPKNTAAPT